MSFEALQHEIQSLDGEQRRKLIAWLVALEDHQDHRYATEKARRLDDQSPGRWPND